MGIQMRTQGKARTIIFVLETLFLSVFLFLLVVLGFVSILLICLGISSVPMCANVDPLFFLLLSANLLLLGLFVLKCYEFLIAVWAKREQSKNSFVPKCIMVQGDSAKEKSGENDVKSDAEDCSGEQAREDF